jgi:hypothetical protein
VSLNKLYKYPANGDDSTILRQVHPPPILKTYLPKIRLNIILPLKKLTFSLLDYIKMYCHVRNTDPRYQR